MTDQTAEIETRADAGGQVDPLDMRETEFGMSNFDHTVDECMADALMGEPGEVFGRHAGCNFNGLVYFHDGKFHEQVWTYGSPRETISADTLENLMDEVNSKYGSD